jgi:hypothetical protein
MRLAQIDNISGPSGVFTDFKTAVPTLVSRVMLFGLSLAGFIFLFRINIAGFTLMTSRGEPAKIKAATTSLTRAMLGLVIVVSAYFIAQIIQYVFGLKIL